MFPLKRPRQVNVYVIWDKAKQKLYSDFTIIIICILLLFYFRAEIEAAKKDIFTVDNTRRDSSLYFTPNEELDMRPVSFNPDQEQCVNPNVSYLCKWELADMNGVIL